MSSPPALAGRVNRSFPFSISSAMAEGRRIHPAWVVLGGLTFCILAGSGLRAAFGVYIKPMEAEFGWSRSALSGVAAVSLLLLGAAGPFVGRLADRWGVEGRAWASWAAR